jgi:hypothetical protein
MHYVITEAQRERLTGLGAERLEEDGIELWRVAIWDKTAYVDADLATPLPENFSRRN